MVVQGDISLFRMPADATSSTTETNITDKVEFGGNAGTPDGRAACDTFRIMSGRAQTKLDVPYTDDVRKPDTGFTGDTYILYVQFDERLGIAGGIDRLRSWIREPNFIRGKFRHGRIGVRNNFRPEFNLTPNNDRGYKIVNMTLDQEVQYPFTRYEIVLELAGDL